MEEKEINSSESKAYNLACDLLAFRWSKLFGNCNNYLTVDKPRLHCQPLFAKGARVPPPKAVIFACPDCETYYFLFGEHFALPWLPPLLTNSKPLLYLRNAQNRTSLISLLFMILLQFTFLKNVFIHLWDLQFLAWRRFNFRCKKQSCKLSQWSVHDGVDALPTRNFQHKFPHFSLA